VNGSALAGPLYVDASALAKLYLPEPQSERLNRALQGRTDLLVSDLALTEIVSALARRRRAGEITLTAVNRIYRAVLGDIEDGTLRRMDLLAESHRDAERLLLTLDETPLRAADALHLALALEGDAGTLATFDLRLAAAARAVGLPVFP
jgi:predicted nucleic acid-binding protein